MDPFVFLSNITLHGGVAQPWQSTNDSCPLGEFSSVAADLAGSEVVAITQSVASFVLCGVIFTMITFPWYLFFPAGLFVGICNLLFSPQRNRPKRSLENVWTIHGKRYDLSKWASQHPGGETAINLGRNRDCTGLFESYHIFADRARLFKILNRFEIPAASVDSVLTHSTPAEDEKSPDGKQCPPVAENLTGMVFCDDFHEDVKQMVREHFKGGRSHKMKLWTFCLCTFLLVFEVVLCYMFLMGSGIALVLLPFIVSLLSANVAHDGSHFAISDRPWVNRMASSMAMPFFFPPTAWNIQHVVQHHVYTNDEADVDLYHFLPTCRSSRKTPWSWQFNLQVLLMFLLFPVTVAHLMFLVPMDLLSGQVDLFTGRKRYYQCQNVEDLVARARGSIWCEFLFCLSWFIINLYVQGLQQGMLRMAILYSTCSCFFIIITQGAHLNHECMQDANDLSWAKRQCTTAISFRPDSHLCQVLTGGLNMQSLHHVIPGVHSSHYADIYPKYKAVCEKHGVELKEAKNIMEFFRGYLSWMQELSHEDL